jgi:hypothetical protein
MQVSCTTTPSLTASAPHSHLDARSCAQHSISEWMEVDMPGLLRIGWWTVLADL